MKLLNTLLAICLYLACARRAASQSLAEVNASGKAVSSDSAQLTTAKELQEDLRARNGELIAEEDSTWTLNAGGLLNTGNTRSVSINAGTRALWVEGRNQVSGDAQFAYGRASVPIADAPGEFEPWQTNTSNLNAQLRYDRFLARNNAIFVGGRGRRDRFAGLDARLQAQVGYLLELFRRPGRRFWSELGYDMTYDDFTPEGDDLVHSVRGFLGYNNQINPYAVFVTGLEALYDVQDSRNLRFQWVSELTSKIEDKLQVSLSFAARLDNVPVENREKLDTLTTANLVYTLM